MNSTVSRSRLSARDLCHCALFVVLLAISSWITIPLTVPFTLQTFAVFGAVLLLGPGRAALALLAYLLLGLAGAPVFSGFGGGPGALFGPTGGYLWGFFAIPLAAALVPARLRDHKILPVAALAAGLFVCYAVGTAWFCLIYSAKNGPISLWAALCLCVFPFIIPDLIKLVLSSLLARRISRVWRAGRG